MATVGELEHRVRELKKRIEELEGKIATISAEYEALIDEQGQNLADSANARIRQIKEGYDSAFDSAIQKTERESSEKIRRLEQNYYALLKERDDLMTELLQRQQEAEKRLRALETDERERDRREKQACEEEKTGYLRAREQTYALPHNAFFPGKGAVYEDVGRNGAQREEEKLYTLAASQYSSGKLGFETLKTDTEQKMQEIKRLLDVYQADLNAIRDAVRDDRVRTAERDGTEYRLSLQETDYWSDGAFGAILRELEAHQKFISDALANPYGAWLTEVNATEYTAVEYLLRRRDRLQLIPRQCSVVLQYAFNAMFLFNRMFAVRGIAGQIFSENNFQYRETRFGPAQEKESEGYQTVRNEHLVKEKCTESGRAPDYREDRVLYYSRILAGRVTDKATVRLHPEREGETATEVITLSVESEFGQAAMEQDFVSLFRANGIMISAEEPTLFASEGPRRRQMTLEAASQIAGVRFRSET